MTTSLPRVLIVDDDPHVRRSLVKALETFADVTDVYSAATALALLNHGQEFDVIVSDFCLDVISGNEFYDVLRHEKPALLDRFILITGSDLETIDADFRRILADRLLRKPISAELLRDRVLRMFARSRGEAPAPPALREGAADSPAPPTTRLDGDPPARE